MTIQQALKSGKPFRRKTWGRKYPKEWYVKHKSDVNIKKHLWWVGNNVMLVSENGMLSLIRDILARDWETKE
jgi:hypothetical protein